MSSSADLLRRAAVKLRERAELAQPGPWHIGNAVDPTQPCNVHTFPGARMVADRLGWLDAEYIATLHPPVALALADVLQAAATDYEYAQLFPLSEEAVETGESLIPVARAVLREPEETP